MPNDSGVRTVMQKSSFKIKLRYYFGVLLVLNHCSSRSEIPSAVLMLLEKTDLVIQVIDFQLNLWSSCAPEEASWNLLIIIIIIMIKD